MTVLDVYLNGRKLCRAGVGNDGVLTAIVNWVKLVGAAARTARQFNAPVEEMRLHVGGLRAGSHQGWCDRSLTRGDRISVVLDRAKRCDPPRRTTPVTRKAPTRATSSREETRFLNVDLDVWSATPLDELAKSFGRQLYPLYVGREGRRHGAHWELARSSDNPDRLIRRFVDAVQRLSPRAKRSWQRATAREFNIGIQAAATPHAVTFPLQPETLAAAASVNARIGVTVYASAGA